MFEDKMNGSAHISELHLSDRARKVLQTLGISYVQQVSGLESGRIVDAANGDEALCDELYRVRAACGTPYRPLNSSRPTSLSDSMSDGQGPKGMAFSEILATLSARAQRAIHVLGVTSTEQFAALTKEQVLLVRAVGITTWTEINRVQQKAGSLPSISEPTPNTVANDAPTDDQPNMPTFEDILIALSTRAQRALHRLGLTSTEQFAALTREQVLSVRAIGITTWAEISRIQHEYGLAPTDTAQSPKRIPDSVLQDLGGRARRVLALLHVEDIASLLRLTEKQVLTVPSVGNSTWHEIRDAQHHLAPLVPCDTPQAQPPPELGPFSERNILAMPLFSESSPPGFSPDSIAPSYSPDSRIDDLDLPPKLQTSLLTADICTIRQLLSMTPGELLHASSCGNADVKRIRNSIVDFLSVMNGLVTPLPLSGRSFDDVKRLFLETCIPDSRRSTVLSNRLGLETGTLMTLEELGRQISLGKERVRQLEQSALASLRSRSSLALLAPLWQCVFDRLELAGGVESVDILAGEATSRFSWRDEPQPSVFAGFLQIHPDLILVGKNTVALAQHHCITCDKPALMLSRLLHVSPEAPLPEAMPVLHACCSRLCDAATTTPVVLSSAFVRHYMQVNVHAQSSFTLEGDHLYAKGNWDLKYGTLSAAALRVLEQHGTAMHFRDVRRALCAYRNGNLSERHVHACLTNTDDAVLWDRGTFIHRRYIRLPDDLIRQVEEWLLNLLENDVPCALAHAAHRAFRQQCTLEHIPSETALYSCLRSSAHPMLAFPRCPYIYRNTPGTAHVPLRITVEEWLKSAGEVVAFQQFKSLLCDKMGLKSFQFNGLLCDLASVVRTDDDGFVHLSVTGLKQKDLLEIVRYARQVLSREEHVSVGRIYRDKQVSCHILGISGPKMLFSLLEQFAQDDLDLEHYPQVRVLSPESESEHRGIIAEACEFVLQAGRPCSFDEIDGRFVDELGYSQGTIRNIFYTGNVFRYARGCVVHRDVLGWTREKQERLEDAARLASGHATKAGHVCSRIDDLIEKYGMDLPSLENGCTWTDTLAASLLSMCPSVQILGNDDNAFVVVPNRFGIASFEDLVCYLLEHVFGGATSVEEMSKCLRQNGLIRKRLTAGMLRKGGRVCLDEYEISLKELA